MQALAASCEELRAKTGNPPLRGHLITNLPQAMLLLIIMAVIYRKNYRKNIVGIFTPAI
jgi:hypothetical protein